MGDFLYNHIEWVLILIFSIFILCLFFVTQSPVKECDTWISACIADGNKPYICEERRRAHDPSLIPIFIPLNNR